MMYYPIIIFIIIPTIIPLLSIYIRVISHLTFLRNMVEDNSRCEALFTTSSSRVPAGNAAQCNKTWEWGWVNGHGGHHDTARMGQRNPNHQLHTVVYLHYL